MGISYCITVCNEFEEIQKLLSFLLLNKKEEDNILVLVDTKKWDHNIQGYLYDLSSESHIILKEGQFGGHFGDWKNQFFAMPFTKDYLIFIDADELPSKVFIDNIHQIIELNQDVDIYGIARVNTVEGITQEHISKWRWSIDNKGRINYPDYQYRIAKNNAGINWVGKVHETLIGGKIKTQLPANNGLDLYHPKSIKKQESQNQLYDKL